MSGSKASSTWVPSSQRRYLRACMLCSICMPFNDFITKGCPNCEEYLQFRGSPETADRCTSLLFEGLMAVGENVDPKDSDNPGETGKQKKSWACKYQRLEHYVTGMYAIKVSGRLPEEVQSSLETDFRVPYIPRDGSAEDAE